MIEKNRGSTCETFLLQEPQRSSPNIHGRTIKAEKCSSGWTTLSTNLSGHSGKMRHQKLDQSNDLQLLIQDEESGSHTSVERFIAVPVSPTYLTDHLCNIRTSNLRESEGKDCTSLVSALVHAPCEPPPPTWERLSPIGANSRSTSKLSLDTLDEETKC